MSQFLNTNEIALAHIPIISWKGKTFTQITSSIKKNTAIVSGSAVTRTVYRKGKIVGEITSHPNLFLPNPLKIYRREIANTIDMSNCYQRSSLKIDEINRPGGSIVNSSATKINGLVNTLDFTLQNNKCEEPGTCSVFLSPADNARRRCRSSGIIKKTYNPANNFSSYYTDSKQYLVSRNKTFLQNQYNYIRVGDPLIKPSAGLAAANIYSPNGLPVCPKFHISIDCTFNYQWVDGLYYPVSIPAGYYDANDFNGKFQYAMSQNYHFLINQVGAKVFLLGILYDELNDRLEFQCSCYDNVNYPSNTYTADIRSSQLWTLNNYGTGINPPNQGYGSSLTPGIQFTNGDLAKALGLTSLSYPVNIPPEPISAGMGQSGVNDQPYTSTQVYTSNTSPGLKSVYKKIYYKPNNGQFGQQGAVSSSSLINRIKYNTINTAAYKTSGNVFGTDATKAYGGNIANALSYGVSENPYTMKDKIGYPNITYPSFLKGSTVQRTCMDTHITSGVKYPN
jgi:hypothetical protein